MSILKKDPPPKYILWGQIKDTTIFNLSTSVSVPQNGGISKFQTAVTRADFEQITSNRIIHNMLHCSNNMLTFWPIFSPNQIPGHYSFQLLKVLARLTLWLSKCLNVWILFCTKIKWEIIGSQKYDVQKRSSYSSSHTDFTSSPFIFSLWHMFEPFLPSQSEKNLKWRGKSKWIIHKCSKPTHSTFNFFTQKSFLYFCTILK